MRVIVIRGSGRISTGIVNQLLERCDEITVCNRGKRQNAPSADSQPCARACSAEWPSARQVALQEHPDGSFSAVLPPLGIYCAPELNQE